MCCHKLKIENILNQNFHSVARIMRQGWDLGALGVKNFTVGICDGVPLTAQSSFIFWSFREYRVLVESRILLKPVLRGVRTVALSICYYEQNNKTESAVF